MQIHGSKKMSGEKSWVVGTDKEVKEDAGR
jgi:hypothetical protein